MFELAKLFGHDLWIWKRVFLELGSRQLEVRLRARAATMVWVDQRQHPLQNPNQHLSILQ